MSDPVDRAGAVRSGEELPREPLLRYLGERFGAGELVIEQYRGGHSNLTYLLRYGEREIILRRGPVGSKVATAHDMGREYRVLAALSAHYSKAPKPLAHCEDDSVIGAPFYLMERVRGVILRRRPPPGMTLDTRAAARLSRSLIETLAELHNLDYQKVGLADLGRPDGYIERQVSGWTKRYELAKTSLIADAERVASWLAANQPSSGLATLVHNDFKFDNLVLDPITYDVIGILDWEMSTIGDPRMDLGTSLCYWVSADDPPALRDLAFAPTSAPGMWSRKELIAHYEDKTGRAFEEPLFFYAFGLFKLAVVVQQIYFRFAQGLTTDKRFAALGEAARILIEHAARCIDAGDISGI